MPPLTDPLIEKVEPWLSFLCLFYAGTSGQDSKEELDKTLVDFRGGQVGDMEHLWVIKLAVPRTLEVDVLVCPSLLGTFIEKVNDDTVKVLILGYGLVVCSVFVRQIERPEERGDTVVVVCAYFLGRVHMMNDGMNKLDKDLFFFVCCWDREATQRPLKESVLGVRYVPECDGTVSIEDFHDDLVVLWARDTGNLALCSPHRIHSGSETFVEVPRRCGETVLQDFIGHI